jgi:hypothetical protein
MRAEPVEVQSITHFRDGFGCFGYAIVIVAVLVLAAAGAAFVFLLDSDEQPHNENDPRAQRSIAQCAEILRRLTRAFDGDALMTMDDVARCEEALGAKLPPDFVEFTLAAGAYNGIVGEFRNFLGERAPHMDIALAHPGDREWTQFPDNYVAFYWIGNGDLEGFKIKDGQCIDRVWTFRHDQRRRLDDTGQTFREWLNDHITNLEEDGFHWNGEDWIERPR